MKIKITILFTFLLIANLQANPPVMKETKVLENKNPVVIEQPIIPEKNIEKEINSNPTVDNEEVSDPSIDLIQKAFNKEDEIVATKETFYSKNKIFKINVREAMTSTVEIPSYEVIKNIVVGDESSFIVEKLEDNIFMIFPQLVNKDTSITLITESKRIYPFYVKSISFESKDLPDLVFRIKDSNKYEYSSNQNTIQKIVSTKNNNEPIDFLEEVELDPSKMNWNYKMKGNKEIAPFRVWNDGLFTYLDFNGKDKKNAVLAYKVVDKVDTHVNVRWSGNIMIIETVGDLTLRSGDKYTCIRLQK
ncbi:MAG: TrbG/VirB9 family P-type conjugative transfer protein [Alphaproteobacteria bacterium]|jgi:ComB9 competence protein|nr:TrbG/VirB9 family P-type conjugative transfer protein [Alphaproteobacteria bacterium]